jgi:signal transduction histidine kinase
MSDLVDSLLTLARADEGRFDIHRTPVDLEPLIREVYETAVILGEDAGLTLSLGLSLGPLGDDAPASERVIVMGDRTRLRQLLLNLVTNAVKYTPAGGNVRMRLGAANGRVALSVADTGIGIAPGDLPHIFDRFWRADSARTRTGERPGAGLGLAICKWIAEAHGGQIDVVSRPGRGTTFTVSLPRDAPSTS